MHSVTHSCFAQFFITYRSCKHLDQKHTVFGVFDYLSISVTVFFQCSSKCCHWQSCMHTGKVVGGLDTLTAMEKIETDEKDKPVKVCMTLHA